MELPNRIESLATMLAAAVIYGAYEHLTLKDNYFTLERDAARLGEQYANAAKAGQMLARELVAEESVEIAINEAGDVVVRVDGRKLYGFPGACNRGQFF